MTPPWALFLSTIDSTRWNEREEGEKLRAVLAEGESGWVLRGAWERWLGAKEPSSPAGPLPLLAQPEAQAAAFDCWSGKVCVSPPCSARL